MTPACAATRSSTCRGASSWSADLAAHRSGRTGTLVNQRTLIVLEEGAEAEVWEQFLSGDAELDGVFNVVTELIVGDNARLRYVCGQGLSERSWIFGAQRAEVGRDGRWTGSRSGSARRAGTCAWRRGWPARAPTPA